MRKALIIGIDNYPSSPLQGCANDASAFARILETHSDGTPNFGIKLNTTITTKAELKALIIGLFKDKNDVALFYFSGHGFFSDSGGYIVTPDYKKYDEGISMDEILALVNKSPAKDKVIILDCCHSGAMGSPNISGGTTAYITEGVTILTASRDSESALEVNGHGVFTNLLLDALQGGAADLSGHITPGSVYAYIDQALGPWDQRPVFKTNVTRFTSLRTISPQIPTATLRKITKYFSEPQQHFALYPSYEDTNTKDDKHSVIEPFAKPEHVAVFKDLQKMQSVGLVVPVDADFMYFAAMNSKSCRLTALGYHYWNLVKNKRI